MARWRAKPARPDAKIEAKTIKLTEIEFIRLVRSPLGHEVDPELVRFGELVRLHDG